MKILGNFGKFGWGTPIYGNLNFKILGNFEIKKQKKLKNASSFFT